MTPSKSSLAKLDTSKKTFLTRGNHIFQEASDITFEKAKNAPTLTTAMAENITGCFFASIGTHKPDISDIEQCVAAIDNYFKLLATHSVRPTISGIATALGMRRTSFIELCDRGCFDRFNGGVLYTYTPPPEVVNFCRELKEGYISLLESYMESGSIAPVCGIFLLKNNGDYVDTVRKEYSIKHEFTSSDQLASKYKLDLVEE